MKKRRFLAAVCSMTLVVLMLAGCGEKTPAKDEGVVTGQPTVTAATAEPTTAPTTAPEQTADQSTGAVEAEELNIGDFLANDTAWEDDGGDYSIKNGKLTFNNAYYGDFCAVRLNEQVQNVTVKYNVQFTDIAKDLSEDAGTWWDAEFLCLVRSNFAGSAFVEGVDGQAGYCVTSWGDMSKFSMGRSGYDDVFGTYDWPLGDGKTHSVEFTVTNNADNTLVYLTLKVDGVVLATATDDGSQVKKERVSFFPNAGGVTLRCKYLGAEITAFGEVTESEDKTVEDTGFSTVDLKDYYGTASAWESNGDAYVLDNTGIDFNTTESGATAAVRLTEQAKDATIKFSLQFTEFAKVSMDDWTWWDSEFLCLLRSALPDKGFTDGQTGYSITSWGDMSTFFLGRSGYDDAFGEFAWPMADGKAHDFEITLENNVDNTAVTITVVIDGTTVATVTDDGSKIKEDRTALFPDAGGVTFRCVYLGAKVQ